MDFFWIFLLYLPKFGAILARLISWVEWSGKAKFAGKFGTKKTFFCQNLVIWQQVMTMARDLGCWWTYSNLFHLTQRVVSSALLLENRWKWNNFFQLNYWILSHLLIKYYRDKLLGPWGLCPVATSRPGISRGARKLTRSSGYQNTYYRDSIPFL